MVGGGGLGIGDCVEGCMVCGCGEKCGGCVYIAGVVGGGGESGGLGWACAGGLYGKWPKCG